ncbi:response regulator [Sphingomonas cannabina]|uniref:response regulator n=1 Tax=Sphingomonas cannabina TaxID=2899123 RepID=UPI001F3C17B9|nr:response regulator [Sphingomonas cannabina]UIJ47287.1 response regulator [Sphingomonas cannabina]
MLFARKPRRITRILIAEDEPLVAFDTEHHLREGGFEIVATVDRVTEAVALIDQGVPIDLVLADLTLADGSGIEVARVASERGVPVLFVTGDCPSAARALAAGCLAKPYAPRDLIAAIDAIERVLEGATPKRLPASFSLFATPA